MTFAVPVFLRFNVFKCVFRASKTSSPGFQFAEETSTLFRASKVPYRASASVHNELGIETPSPLVPYFVTDPVGTVYREFPAGGADTITRTDGGTVQSTFIAASFLSLSNPMHSLS